ncbi:MAG: right-handed parallel beta-helix repeat-containing protein [Rhodothermales bacterium]|nr:right-handed parallel beta-helix repeat-containing protein [Rhodothermales bacterium]
MSIAAVLISTLLLGVVPSPDSSSVIRPGALDTVPVEIYVDANNPVSTDQNAGTVNSPLLTVQEGVRRARENKRRNVASVVIINPGVYRETVTLAWTNRPENQPDNATPILVRASESGTVRLTGSDIWEDWTYRDDTRVLEHEWLFDWGEFDPGWELQGLAARREMIFVNGDRMLQVDEPVLVEDYTFFVDEMNDVIRLKLPAKILATDPTIEVAVREVVWDQRYENNVTIDGIRFDHAATPWKGGQGAVRVTWSRNVEILNSEMHQNNWAGLYVGQSDTVSLGNVAMNDNGGQGWNTWRVRTFSSTDTETSYNNWRGALSGFKGWSVGNKLESMHGVSIRNHIARGNHSRGLWLDYDIQDAILDSLLIENNEGDGIWLEANPGPIAITNSKVLNNGESGIRTTFTENVTLENNLLASNALRQIEIAGKDKRWVRDFVSQERLHLTVRNWTVRSNELSGGENLIGVASNVRYKEWEEFTSTLTADNNRYVSDKMAAFLVLNKTLSFIEARSREDFRGWRDHTGQDSNSSFVHSN